MLSAIFFCVGLLVLQAHASGAPEHYQSTQIVYDKSQETLQRSIATAFNHVLSKQTGTIISQNDWSQTPPQIETMVDRYDYTKANCQEDSVCYQLAISFNPESIQNTLQAIELTAWQGTRPNTLLWLQPNQEYTASSGLIDAYAPLSEQLKNESELRALSLLLPNGDITDQQLAMKEPQVPTLDYLQSKYHVQQILVGTYDDSKKDHMRFTWHLYSKKHNHDWESQASSIEKGLSSAIDHIVNLGKMNQKQAPASLQKSIIEIKQLVQYDDFNQLANRLQSTSSIKKVSVVAIGADFFAIELQHLGTTESLIAQLQTLTCLQSNIESPSTSNAIASYQWLPDFEQQT